MLRILRLSDMLELTGVSRSTLYNRLDPNHNNYDPEFPKPIKLGPRLNGWNSENVELWIHKTLNQ